MSVLVRVLTGEVGGAGESSDPLRRGGTRSRLALLSMRTTAVCDVVCTAVCHDMQDSCVSVGAERGRNSPLFFLVNAFICYTGRVAMTGWVSSSSRSRQAATSRSVVRLTKIPTACWCIRSLHNSIMDCGTRCPSQYLNWSVLL